MRITRVYCCSPLQPQQAFDLPDNVIHHLGSVLRAKVGDNISLFNGDGYDYPATIEQISKKSMTVLIADKIKNLAVPNFAIHLAQCVCRGEKMDFVIQKATELGVTKITPVVSEFGNVNLKHDRWEKKIAHWQKVANSACEQSGRADVVTVNAPIDFMAYVETDLAGEKLILCPEVKALLPSDTMPVAVNLLVGPEGGFSHSEISAAEKNGFSKWQLGPRVLRSETAGLAAISVLQYHWGDS